MCRIRIQEAKYRSEIFGNVLNILSIFMHIATPFNSRMLNTTTLDNLNLEPFASLFF